ncbi:Nuclear import receptor [Saitoella coloradoensis]
MSDPTTDPKYQQLFAALQTLYTNSARADKERANTYLEEFQKSAEAWQAVHAILSSSTAGLEAKMFAAQTMRTKITYDFHQLPKESLASLRDSLLGLLVMYRAGPKPIMIQLAVSLAGLALQMTEWKTVLQDVVQHLGNDKETWPAMLQFIAVLPEEVSDSKRVSLTEEELDARTMELLTDNADQVLQLLVQYAQTAGPEGPSPVFFACLTSWLKEIPLQSFIATSLFDLTFSALAVDSCFDAAVDLLCSIFKETREVDEYMMVIQAIYPRLLALRPKIAESREDPDAFRGYARLFADAGESWVVLIARMPREFRALVEAIAEVCAYDEDLEAVKFTFYFWYDLKQMLTIERYAEARAELRDIYAGLVDIMIKHLHYPNGDNPNDLFDGDREAEEKFRSFRHEMGDVLKDCCVVVGGSECLHKAWEKVYMCLQNGTTKWQDIEAPLFSMRAMAREIPFEEDSVLPHIMEMLVKLPEHEKIRYAATLVLGRYTQWTSRHPQFLEYQLQYITSGFKNSSKDVMSAAAQALKHFCQDCNQLLIDYVPQLHPFYQQVTPALHSADLFEVTEGLSHVVAAQPPAQLYDTMKMFCAPIAQSLMAHIPNAGTADEDLKKKIADEIELLTIFIQNVAPFVEASKPHPCVTLMQELWPVLSALLQAYGNAPFVAERISKCVRSMMNAYRMHMLPLLPAIAEMLVVYFDKLQYGCFLWVSGTLVRNFGELEVAAETKGAVWSFVQQQAINMFKILNKTQPKDIPDVIEDFFRFMGDVIMNFPQQFCTSNLLDPTFQAALVSLSLEQQDPLVSILHFMRDMLAWALPSPPTSIMPQTPPEVMDAVRAMTSQYGPQLTSIMFSGMIHTLPRDCVQDASGVLLMLLEIFPQEAVGWIAATVAALPEGTSSAEERQKFMSSLTGALQQNDIKKARRLVQDFTAHYRRRNVTPRNATRGLDYTFSYSG